MSQLVCEFVAFNLRPEPKRRPRFGNGRTYTDAATVAYENKVATHARKAMGSMQPTADPVAVTIHLAQTDARVCDIDNAGKAILDAINGVAFVDDRQVCELHLTREVRAEGNRVHVRVEAVTQ